MASSFLDMATISVQAGNGGNGAVAFHREKYVTAGGPDGGDGGDGGDVIFAVDPHMSTLLDFHFKKKYVAENGSDGTGKRKSGRDGGSITIRVPRGTIIRHAETNQIIKDMSDDEPFVLAKGGRGGWGNQHFATASRQAPRFAKAGLPGERLEIRLELKLLADVGLIGMPNAGKSTLLSVISKAHPKIANYPFTTLSPNLGVVYVNAETSFVAADIPGLIEGASEGAGLGHEFLRHIDRCRLLLHLVDVSGHERADPVADFLTINQELRQYSSALASRPQIVVANKADILTDPGLLEALKAKAESMGFPFFAISAATHLGVSELIQVTAAKLDELPPIVIYEPEYVPAPPLPLADEERFQIRREDDAWVAEGPWLERLIANVNFGDFESRNYFDRCLRNSGLFAQLEERGIQDGDTVRIYSLEFEYQR